MKRNLMVLECLSMLLVGAMGCKDKPLLFTTLPEGQTNIDFNNNVFETDAFNINEYLYAFNGGGVVVGDFNNDGLQDIYFTANQLPNRLYLNKGDFTFEDVTESSGVGGLVGPGYWTTGATVVDIDQDGWLDLYVCQVSDSKNFQGKNQLYVNNGDGSFTEKAAQYGLALEGYSQQAIFFDYDLDGDLDMYQLNHSVHELDVYVKAEKRNVRDPLAGDRLFRNDGQFFTDVSEAAGIFGGATGYGLSVAVSDLDGNGCPDLYVSNDFHDNDYVYYNQCNGTFSEAVKETMGHTSTFSMGNDIADLNNDGLPDIISLDMKPEDEIIRKKSAGADPYDIAEYKRSFGFHYQYPRNMLQLNRGNLFGKHTQFSEVGQWAGVDATDWSWSVLLADFDNDGLKDIHITNGILRRPNDLDYINFIYNAEVGKSQSSLELAKKMPAGEAKNYGYRNTGKLVFENVSKTWGLDLLGYSMGAAYVDLDNDGDLDLVVNNLDRKATVYKNNAIQINQNKYLKITLHGNAKNRNGIGAKVEVQLDDKILLQEVNPVRGWLSSSEMNLNFGLGKSEQVKKVKVTWYDGAIQEMENVMSNQHIDLYYENGSKIAHKKAIIPKLFTPITEAHINFRHKEDKFVDFNIERLIPHKLSTQGPGIAVADVNGDQLEDFFIGGAKGQASELYLQTVVAHKHGFVKAHAPIFENDSIYETVAAVFFDADADGDKDLYVVNGDGQSKSGHSNEDQLYINLGNGQFEKSGQFPIIEGNGSCAVAADFNGDGFKDLFVGSRSIPGSYGVSPNSYLLWNDGKGNFTLDTSKYTSQLKGLGMVTGAVWDDKTKNLVVVGEWMPITFLKFETKNINKWELPDSSGWWNTIYMADLDADGDMDLLVGNMGANSQLKATVEKPLQLLTNDWDKNGSIDPLLVYYKNEQEWLYNGLDELKKQMPRIANRYNSYGLFADHTLDKVFSEVDLKGISIGKAVILESVLLINKGERHYSIQKLPFETQMAPVRAFMVKDFDKDGHLDVVTAGNALGNTPSLGNDDASYGSFLTGNGKCNFKAKTNRSCGFSVKGEVNDMKAIRVGEVTWLLVGKNNDRIAIFETEP